LIFLAVALGLIDQTVSGAIESRLWQHFRSCQPKEAHVLQSCSSIQEEKAAAAKFHERNFLRWKSVQNWKLLWGGFRIAGVQV